MSPLELYRQLYEHEKDANQKMLAMLESVPEANRGDARFQKALTLTGHLAACRENWLNWMEGSDFDPVNAWSEQVELTTLRPRFSALESRWTHYLAHLDENRLAQDFEFSEAPDESFSLPVEVQIIQLIGHAPYHRGQIALLVDQLGGETIDTDYADWWWMNQPQ